MTIDLTKKIGKNAMQDFVSFIKEMSAQIGFKVSARGWAYILEQHGYCTKDQFDKIQNVVNRARQKGLLPVDFVAEEAARAFQCVHIPTEDTYPEHIRSWVNAAFDCEVYFTPDWWNGEKYYIQMVVEKIDLVTLFEPICDKFHIPIANSKGWSSILQRAEYCRRFAGAEAKGLQCVLLYCGDHDPDGLRISDTLRKNLEDVSEVTWRRLCEETIIRYLGNDAERRFRIKREKVREDIAETFENSGARDYIQQALNALDNYES